MQAKDWYNLGVYTTMSVMQGGSGFPFMADAVYNYFCTGDSTGIIVPNDKVPNHILRCALEKVCVYNIM